MAARVLLVDDDVELVELLRDYLEREGFEVETAHDGDAGVCAALSASHDIVVMDVMMPGRSGIQALNLIRAILKRAGSTATSATQPLVGGALTLWPAQRRAEHAGRTLELTGTEFNLLEVLARNAGRPVSKADLSQEALGRALTRFDRSIDVHMSSIRHKLGALVDGRSCIQTVIRKGYQLIAE